MRHLRNCSGIAALSQLLVNMKVLLYLVYPVCDHVVLLSISFCVSVRCVHVHW